MTISVVILSNFWVIRNAGLISNSGLAIITLISIIIGKPFTIQYAKEIISEDKWKTPLFIRINYTLSIIWFFLFLSQLGIYLLRKQYPDIHRWIFSVLSYFPIVWGVWINSWLPNWLRNRYLRKHVDI